MCSFSGGFRGLFYTFILESFTIHGGYRIGHAINIPWLHASKCPWLGFLVEETQEITTFLLWRRFQTSLAVGLWGHFLLGCKLQEFFDFACPASSLGVFLEMCNDKTLLHPFCDLRFSRFLQEYYQGGKVMQLGLFLFGGDHPQMAL